MAKEKTQRVLEIVDNSKKVHTFEGAGINFFCEGTHVRVYSTQTIAAFVNYISCKFVDK